jgi:NADH dehydrogenase FAD-containing subunit
MPYGTLVWASGIATRPVVKGLMEKLGKVCAAPIKQFRK